MRFYETETEFILLKKGENAPKNCNYYTFREHMFFSNFTIEKFELAIYHYLAQYPAEDITYFTYKGFSFRLIGNPVGMELIELLNKLKKGDRDKILLEIMTNSIKIYPEFTIDINTSTISSLNSKILKLTDHILYK